MGKIYNEQRIIGAAGVDGAGNVPSASSWSYAAAAGGIASSTADVALKGAAAGVVNYLTALRIDHDALGAATEFVVKDGSTVIHRGKLQTAAQEARPEMTFSPPLKTTAGAALNFALLTSTTGGVFVNAQGYTGT